MKPTIYHLADGIELFLYPNWVQQAQTAFNDAEKLTWSPEVVTMRGKSSVILRRTVDYGLNYSYNKTSKASIAWESLPLALKAKLEADFTEYKFEQCACNEYRDGLAYISAHHDKHTIINDERREPLIIASISLGAVRKMVLTPPGANLKGLGTPTVKNMMKVPGAVGIDLPSGSLAVFTNAFNKTWKHSIPIDTDVTLKRLSLTYRHF